MISKVLLLIVGLPVIIIIAYWYLLIFKVAVNMVCLVIDKKPPDWLRL